MKTVADFALHRPTPVRPNRTRCTRYAGWEEQTTSSHCIHTQHRSDSSPRLDADAENGRFRELAMIENELNGRRMNCGGRWSCPEMPTRPGNPMVRDPFFREKICVAEKDTNSGFNGDRSV